MLPVALHSALAILFSATIFPSTVSSFYITKCHGVLLPLRSTLQEHKRLLQESTESPAFTHTKANDLTAASEAGLAPVTSAIYLLKRDIVWCRFSPSDFAGLHDYARRLVVRASGMSAYFGIIDPTRERFPTTPGPSVPGSPARSPGPSRPPSVHEDIGTGVTETHKAPFGWTPSVDGSVTLAPSDSTPESPVQPGSIRGARRRNGHSRHPRFSEHKASLAHEHIHYKTHHRHNHIMSHGPLLPLVRKGPGSSQPAVGLYEATRYAGLEEKLAHPGMVCNTEKFHRLLKNCCEDMLEVADEVFVALDGWLNTVTSKSRFKFWRNKEECRKTAKEALDGYVQLKEKMDRVLEVFEKEKRSVVLADASHCTADRLCSHIVVDPYRASLDPKAGNAEGSHSPSHRHLFHCYVYQYHLWQFVKVLSELVRWLLPRTVHGYLT